MAFTTYAELKTAAALWVARTDLTAVLDDFVTLAEARLKREILSRFTEVKVTASATELMTLPTDLGQLLRVCIVVGTEDIQLDYLPARAIDDGAPGQPEFYTVETAQLRLIPAPSGTISVTIYYVPKLPALSLGPNWLLINHPDVYLWATCCEAAKFLKDGDDEARFEQRLQSAAASLQAQSERLRLGASSRLSIRARNVR